MQLLCTRQNAAPVLGNLIYYPDLYCASAVLLNLKTLCKLNLKWNGGQYKTIFLVFTELVQNIHAKMFKAWEILEQPLNLSIFEFFQFQYHIFYQACIVCLNCGADRHRGKYQWAIMNNFIGRKTGVNSLEGGKLQIYPGSDLSRGVTWVCIVCSPFFTWMTHLLSFLVK